MAEKKFQHKKLSNTNTKQEMLDAYNALVKQFQENREAELKPEEKIQEREIKEVVEKADALSTDGIVTEIGGLKSEMSRLLTQLSDRLEDEVNRYSGIKKAVEVKQRDLQEIYEIERSASTMAALIEAQHQKREEFEAEMSGRKEELTREIHVTRAEWEKEKKQHEAEIKERDAAEQKRREREKEEYHYSFTREQQLAKDKFEDEKGRAESELQTRREQMERELAEREKAVAGREEELNDLRAKVEAFPKRLETAINETTKETTQRLQQEAKGREEILRKEFAGERNVHTTRIEALESVVKEQAEQITRLSQQLEKAYGQIQDIAIKTVEGSSNAKSLTGLQQMITEQVRKQAQEK